MKDIKTSIKAQIEAVPMRAPYPSGHGSGLPSESEGQNPEAYLEIFG